MLGVYIVAVDRTFISSSAAEKYLRRSSYKASAHHILASAAYDQGTQ
jgi:hypothetical protein